MEEAELESRVGDFMQMSDGSVFWPFDPRPGDFSLKLIANHLGKICRYNGATKDDIFYSVAQHSVHVSKLVPARFRLEALLHDAWEHVSSDVVRPIKRDPSMQGFRNIELIGEQVLAEQFGLVYPWPDEVMHADNVSLATEKRDILAECVLPWVSLPEPDKTPINFHWSPKAAGQHLYIELVWAVSQRARDLAS